MSRTVYELLKTHRLRNTLVRARVLEIFLSRQEALSQSDIEGAFEKVDRITLYRTLRTFEHKGLIHRAIDGGDKVKYALCHGACSEVEHDDHHAHFHCDQCGKTFCLEEIEAPAVKAPAGFQVNSTYLVVQGRCETCSAVK